LLLKRICFTAGVVYAFGGVLLAPLNAQTALLRELQVQETQAPPDDASLSPSSPAPFVPLTLGENYLFTLNKVFSPGSMFLYSLHASIDQAMIKPQAWGTGPGGYALRSANVFGRSFVRQNVAFGVRALDHEDPRYFVLGHGGGWTRVKYAIERTFVVRNDSGGNMPAYSLFASSFATPYIADEWRPGVVHPLRAGTLGVGFAVGSNVFQEFWPDIKKKLDLDGRLHAYHEH
jgi:hypothetical protein